MTADLLLDAARQEAPPLETPVLFTVSREGLRKLAGQVTAHVAAGGVVRITDNRAGQVLGWIYPAGHEPPWYRASSLADDEDAMAARVLAHRRQRAAQMNAVRWHGQDGQAHD